MDMERINADAAKYRTKFAVDSAVDEWRAEHQAEAEAEEANKGILDRINDTISSVIDTDAIRNAMGETYHNEYDMNPSTPRPFGAVQDIWGDMMAASEKTREARARYAQEWKNLHDKKMSGQVTPEDEENFRQADSGVKRAYADMAASPFRQAARIFIKNNADDSTSPFFQGMAQSLLRTDVAREYFMTKEEVVQKSREVEQELGLPAESTLASPEAYKNALEMYEYKKKSDNIEEVWEKYPELQSIANKSKEDAVIALNNMPEVKETHGVIDTFMSFLEKGNTELEYNNLQWKIMHGRATDEEVQRADTLKKQIENDKRKAPGFFQDPFGAVAAGVAGSLPEMGQSIIGAGEGGIVGAGAVAGTALTIAAVASTVLTGGTSALAASGIAGARAVIMNALRSQAGRSVIKKAAMGGAIQGMAEPESGSRYAKNKAMTKPDGTPLYTDSEAKNWALLGGYTNAVIEIFPTVGIAGKTLPATTRVFSQSVETVMNQTLGRETIKDLGVAAMGNWLKLTATESAEEAVQSVADDVIGNAALASKGQDAAKYEIYGVGDILTRAGQAFVESLPASMGFGFVGVGGSAITGVGRMARSRKRVSEMENQYGKEQTKTMMGVMAVEQLQKTVENGNMNKVAPDVQKKVLREQLKGTGFENAYIDVEMAMKKETGREDLKKIAEAQGMSAEELEAAINVNGYIPVGTETLAQAKASPDILDSVSFSPESDSMARMRENGKRILEDYRKNFDKMIKRQQDFMDTIVKEYMPNATKEQKEAVRAAMLQNPSNPAQGWNALRKIYNDELQELYKTFKRQPTNAELEDMAIAMTVGDSSAPQVAGWTIDSAEAQEAFAQEKPIIDSLKNSIALLDSIKGEVKKLTGVEMELTAGLSPEAYKVYRALSSWTEKAGGKIARAGRMSALLTARHADIFAEAVRNNTGRKNYTAEDYLRERLGFQLVPQGQKIQAGLNQLAGEQAGNAPLEALERAKAMNGTPDEIYAATGWVKGKDGKWRFEIPDKMESIDFGNVDEYGEGQLDGIYDNPKLYEAYPQLMFTQVILDDEMGNVNGQTINNVVGNTWIKINANIDEQEKKKVLIHEIQHAIQQIENFAGGGSERTVRWQLENRLNEITDEKEKQKMREALEKYSDSRLYYMLAGEEEARRTADRAEARQQTQKEAAEAKEKFEALKAQASPEKLKVLAEYEKAYKEIYSKEEPTEADEKHFEEVAKRLDDEDLRNAFQENEWYQDSLKMWEEGKWETPEPHSSYSLIVFNGVEYNAEEKNLSAFHNTSVDSLEKLINEGLAVPSIAITKKDILFDNFGEVTLIGNRKLIDPANNVPVWTRDAYTTRLPHPEYKAASDEKIKAFVTKWREELKGIDEADHVMDLLENAAKYEPEAIERRIHKSEFDFYYLTKVLGRNVEIKHKRPDYEVPILRAGKYTKDIESIMRSKKKKADKKKALTEILIKDAQKDLDYYAESIPKRKASMEAMPANPKRKLYYEKAVEHYQDAQKKLDALQQAGEISEEEYKTIQKDISRVDKAEKENTEIDWFRTFQAMREIFKDDLNDEKHQKWNDKLVDSVRGDAVIKVGRKYEPYTTDNIVRAMLRESGAGQEGMMGFSTSKAAAVGATPLQSIADLHKNESRLVTREQAKKIIADVDTAIYDSFEGVREYHKHIEADSYSLPDIFNEAVANAIKGGKKATKANVTAALKKMDFDTAKIPAKAIDNVVAAANQMRDAAAWYFEAKPQRAVGIEEFSGAVVPESTPADTIKKLRDKGLTVETYDPTKDGDRQRAVEAVQNERMETLFQRRDGLESQGGITIKPGPDGRRIISIMESADESTFMHEMAHEFLFDLEDLAQIDETSKKELEIVNQWATWEKGAAQEYKGTAWAKEFANREQAIIDAEAAGDFDEADKLKAEWRQERFARGFELYLKEGQAPARGLKAVFRKFKSFLVIIYKQFTGDGGKPTLPVKRVMDRMIASEDEIEAAALEDRYSDLTKAGGEKLLNEKEEETMKRWYEEERAAAKEKILKVIMKDLEKEKQKVFDNKMAEERENYEKQLKQENIFVARRAYEYTNDKESVTTWFDTVEEFEALDSVTPDMKTLVDRHMKEYGEKLDASLMESHLSKEAVDKAMDSSKYRVKMEGMITRGMERRKALLNRINAKAQAAMDSIEEKLNALPEDVDIQLEKKDNPTIKKILKEINKLRFANKWNTADINHIEAMLRASTQEDVRRALKDFKAQKAAEKKNLEDVEAATKGMENMYKDLITQATATKPMTETCNVKYYMDKERNAGRRVKAMMKAKNWDVAIQQQRNKVFYAMMVKQARENQETRDKMVKDLKRKLNAKTIRLPKDERYWFNRILYLMRLNTTDPKIPEGGVAKLDDIFKEQRETLDVLTGPEMLERIQNEGENFGDFNKLSLPEFRAAYDDLVRLYTIGRDKFNFKSIGGKSIEEVAAEIMRDPTANRQVMTLTRKIGPDQGGLSYVDSLGNLGETGHAVAKNVQKYHNSIIKPENMLTILGEKAHKYIYGLLERAAEQEAKLAEKNLRELQKINAMYSRKERQAWTDRKYDFPGTKGWKISKENIIMMAMNWGTEKNRQRLIGGLIEDGRYKNEQSAADVKQSIEILYHETMTAKDWEYVQKLWDHIGSFWHDTAAVEEKLNGIALGRVENLPFKIETADGKTVKLQGGYMHIKYDFEKSSRAEEQEIEDMAMSITAGARVLGVGRSMVKSRSENNIYRELDLHFSVIENHLQDVIHNITYRVPLRDIYRLLHYKNYSTGVNLEEYMRNGLGVEAYRVIDTWALDAWRQVSDNRNSAEGFVSKMLRWLRTNATMAVMGYRVKAVLENAGNIPIAMNQIGSAEMLGAMYSFYSDPRENMREVTKMSAYMRTRAENLDRDLRQQPGVFRAGNRLYEVAVNHAYDALVWTDLAVSAPLWQRAYKNSFNGKLKEVQKENEENMAKRLALAEEADKIRAQIADNQNAAAGIDEHLRIRRYGRPEEIEALRGTEYAGISEGELRAQWGQHKKEIRGLEKDLFKLEQEQEKANQLPVYTDDELLEEAKQRAVFEADKAVRDTFGSGRVIDQAAISRSRNELVRLFTAFYSFFNAQYNLIYMSYMKSKYPPEGMGHIERWTPFAKTLMFNVILSALITSTIGFAFGLKGNDKDEKERAVVTADGKKEKQEIPGYERFMKVFAKECLSVSTGGLYGIRDVTQLAGDLLFSGQNFGYKMGSVATRGLTEAGRAVTLMMKKGEKDAEIQAQQDKKEREHQEKLKKYKGKKRREYLQKWEADQKYKKPPKRITYAEITGHAAKGVATLTAARTGITTTMTNAITSTMEYMLDTDMRFDPTWKNIVWSAIFDKRPVEREIPKKPPAEPKKKKRKQSER